MKYQNVLLAALATAVVNAQVSNVENAAVNEVADVLPVVEDVPEVSADIKDDATTDNVDVEALDDIDDDIDDVDATDDVETPTDVDDDTDRLNSFFSKGRNTIPCVIM